MQYPAPEYIQFFPTLRCNQNCSFCFNRGINAVTDSTQEDIKRLAGRVADIGTTEIDILGGEPTLYPHLHQFIDLSLRNGFTLNISSNGSNIPVLEDITETFKGKPLNIGISLNTAPLPDTLHRYISTYRPFVKSIYESSGTIPAPFAPYLGMQDITYYLLYRDVLSANELEHSVPFYTFFNRLRELRAMHNNIENVYCAGFIPDTARHPFLAHVRCPAGTTKLSVLPDGSVYPCYLFFRHKEFRLGNILDDNFTGIWRNPRLDFFRTFGGNRCPNAGCELFSACHGGCPAVSLSIAGDLTAPDPRCIKK